ncbi:Uncharacterised protein [uncultured archaeon]|nr:Uncharacterised protein [uncultured archaeon]
MKTLKGQSAVEYVTTYGWAIFALLIVIALLLGSGVLTPNFFIQEKCSLGANMPCRAALYNDASGQTKVSLELLNGFAYKIRVNSVEVLSPDDKTAAQGFNTQVEMESGANATFQGAFPAKMADNGMRQLTLRVNYVSCAPELGPTCTDAEHPVTGTIVARILPSQ